NYPGTVYLDLYDQSKKIYVPEHIPNLYISLPFCSRRCSFCTIVSDISIKEREEYFKALFKEMEFYKRDKKVKVNFIDLGGGTASMLTPRELDNLLYKIRECFDIGEEPKICFEAHPELARQENRFELLHIAKKHRIPNIAFGVQTFDDSLLKRLNRGHDVNDVWKAVSLSKKFLPSFSIDLMCGLEGQSMESIKKTIIETIKVDPGAIDLYTYVNSHRSIDKVSKNRDTLLMIMFLLNALSQYGWYPHRISASVILFKKVKDMESTMNALEGMGEFGDMNLLGIGNGAFSFNRRYHSASPYDIRKYMDNVKRNGIGFSLYSEKGEDDFFYNYIKDSLRRYSYLDIKKIDKRFNIDFRRSYAKILDKLRTLGLIAFRPSEDNLRLTKLGFIYEDKVSSFFFPEKHFRDYFALEQKVKNSHLAEFYEEICNSPFNFELTPEIHDFIKKNN
ncbi:MAG: radical SAM protein, partial [Candidatus Woesearchaeota archaeon]